ncbi:MAG: hypothetical protein ACR2PT_23595, partial [Endozoicomonas sp.]
SHKRPHELSDILLKNLFDALLLMKNRLNSNSESASVPFSEAAILPRRFLLSSACFSEELSRERDAFELAKLTTCRLLFLLSGGAFYRVSRCCQPPCLGGRNRLPIAR